MKFTDIHRRLISKIMPYRNFNSAKARRFSVGVQLKQWGVQIVIPVAGIRRRQEEKA